MILMLFLLSIIPAAICSNFTEENGGNGFIALLIFIFAFVIEVIIINYFVNESEKKKIEKQKLYNQNKKLNSTN